MNLTLFPNFLSSYALRKEKWESLDSHLKLNLSYDTPERFSEFHEQKKLEFIQGRFCAFQAISKIKKLNYDEKVLGIDLERRPIWPKDIVGSLSHNKNWVVAVCANKADVKSIGIDIELIGRLSKKVSKKIIYEKDISESEYLNDDELKTLIFSAKESLFKCLNPLVNQYFGFDYAALTSLQENSFQIELTKELNSEFGPQARFEFKGIFEKIEDSLLTCITLMQ